jgi:ribonuclease HIII
MEQRNSFTFTLTEGQQAALILILEQGNYRPATVPYSTIAADAPDCRIVLYQSGKCVVQGKGAQDFVTFVMEPQVLMAVKLGYEEIVNPEAFTPHIGVDESGKGDFFGPIVIASAYTDGTLTKAMQEIGVRDSKNITSDNRLLDIAKNLRQLLNGRYSIIAIGPEKYNQLYTKIRSVNNLLAWGHARAIENLLEKVPHCNRAVSDQFGSKEQVKRALMQKGRKIELIQMHKAESDIAVAAASILAREAFLFGLRKLGEQHGVKLPKGASNLVQDAAVTLIEKHSPAILLQAAKCHFKTTDSVLARVGQTRSILGAEGAATSATANGYKFKRPIKPNEGSGSRVQGSGN